MITQDGGKGGICDGLVPVGGSGGMSGSGGIDDRNGVRNSGGMSGTGAIDDRGGITRVAEELVIKWYYQVMTVGQQWLRKWVKK